MNTISVSNSRKVDTFYIYKNLNGTQNNFWDYIFLANIIE